MKFSVDEPRTRLSPLKTKVHLNIFFGDMTPCSLVDRPCQRFGVTRCLRFHSSSLKIDLGCNGALCVTPCGVQLRLPCKGLSRPEPRAFNVFQTWQRVGGMLRVISCIYRIGPQIRPGRPPLSEVEPQPSESPYIVTQQCLSVGVLQELLLVWGRVDCVNGHLHIQRRSLQPDIVDVLLRPLNQASQAPGVWNLHTIKPFFLSNSFFGSSCNCVSCRSHILGKKYVIISVPNRHYAMKTYGGAGL
jgi:hypothetical protein